MTLWKRFTLWNIFCGKTFTETYEKRGTTSNRLTSLKEKTFHIKEMRYNTCIFGGACCYYCFLICYYTKQVFSYARANDKKKLGGTQSQLMFCPYKMHTIYESGVFITASIRAKRPTYFLSWSTIGKSK